MPPPLCVWGLSRMQCLTQCPDVSLACYLHGCALLPVCPVLAQGDLCRVWDGSQPVILQPKDEPYVFNSPVFRLASVERDGYPAFISQSEKVRARPQEPLASRLAPQHSPPVP